MAAATYSTTRRRAAHASTWYSASAQSLRRSLSRWLESSLGAPSDYPRPNAALRAIIAPHAGYSYSGRIAAYAYNAVDAARITRVFVLGPSHHVYIDGRCALSTASVLETPLGALPTDVDTVNALYERAPHLFQPFAMEHDEQEHSIEMHLPYLRHIFTGKDVSVVPIVVGTLSLAAEVQLGKLLAPWLADPATLFVISSDFCHWGQRFDYTRYVPSDGDIWRSIENLDRRGMSSIETLDQRTFHEYIESTQNTICGRHAIGILLAAIDELRRAYDVKMKAKFTHYDQSSKVRTMDESSVSYAAACIYVPA